ncbi:MAG: hypothetical protein ACR2JG_06685 [Geodermatophilaceae bacterium]
MSQPRAVTWGIQMGFLDAAMVHESSEAHRDAYVTLCVLAGIAASDVICCARLGEHAQGEKHNDAVSLLKAADKQAAKHLAVLLEQKTKSAYSHALATPGDAKRAAGAAIALVEAARRANASAVG